MQAAQLLDSVSHCGWRSWQCLRNDQGFRSGWPLLVTAKTTASYAT
jgi:hypothetical protein